MADRAARAYGDAYDAPPAFLLFYNNSAFQELIRTAEPPDSSVPCAIEGDDYDFVAGPETAKLNFHAKLKALNLPMLTSQRPAAERLEFAILPTDVSLRSPTWPHTAPESGAAGPAVLAVKWDS
jgi:hypothetical protein